MADNVQASLGTEDGEVFATDQHTSGAHYPWVKLVWGPDNTFTPVSTAGPLPVTLMASSFNVGDVDIASFPAAQIGQTTMANSLSVAIASNQTSVPIDGDVTATLSAVDNQVLDDIKDNTADLNNVVGMDGSAKPSKSISIAGVDPDSNLQAVRVKTNGAFDVAVSGLDDHADIPTGGPIKLGAKAHAHGAPTAVLAGQLSDIYCNRHGVLFTIGGHPAAITKSALTTSSETNTALVTAGSGEKIAVTRVTVLCHNANTQNVGIKVGFGASAVPTPTTGGVDGLLLDYPGVAAGGGATIGDGSGIIGVGADGEDLLYTCDEPATGSLTVAVTYFSIPS